MRVLSRLMVGVLLLAGCGSGVPEERLQQTLGWPGEPAAPTAAAAPAFDGGPPATTAGIDQSSRSSPVAPARQESPAAPDQRPVLTAPTRQPAGGGPAPTIAGGSNSAPTRPGSAGAPPSERDPKAPASPVVIGSVGTLSGPVGAAMQGGTLAVRVWAKARNELADSVGGRSRWWGRRRW